MLALPGAYGGLEPLPLRPRGVPWASKRQLVLPVMDVGLGICPHGIRGPLAKTGTHPTGEPASNRHDGALLTPGRRYPVKNFLEHLVTGKSAPGGFDEQVTHATGALATAMATPHSRPRRILARGQPRVAEERPLIGQAGHIAALSRQGPGDHRADARDAPIHVCEFRLRGGWCPQQAAYLDELARAKPPLLGQQRETHAEFWGQRPGSNLPQVPVADHAPTRRGDQAELMQLGFDLAGNRGTVIDNLRAGSWEEPGEFLAFRGDIDTSHASVSYSLFHMTLHFPGG